MRSIYGFLALISLLATVSMAPLASAQDGPVQVTMTAVENDCPDQEAFYCWEVEGGENVEPGDTVEVTVENPSDNQLVHNLYVRFDAQHQQDTPANAAEANTSDIAPGEEGNVTFTVPDDATNVYYWCEVPPHEAQGMWGIMTFETSDDGDDGTDGDAGIDDGNGSPGLGALALVATMAAAAVALAQRRN